MNCRYMPQPQPGQSVRETVIVLPDCTTENVSACWSLPHQLFLLTMEGHIFGESITIVFDWFGELGPIPIEAKEHPGRRAIWRRSPAQPEGIVASSRTSDVSGGSYDIRTNRLKAGLQRPVSPPPTSITRNRSQVKPSVSAPSAFSAVRLIRLSSMFRNRREWRFHKAI